MSAGGLGSIAAAAAAQQGATTAEAGAPDSKEVAADDEDDEMPELEAAEEAGPVDEGDLDPKEIEMVMTQVCISTLYRSNSELTRVFFFGRRDAPGRKLLPY
jgi:hypothetical protein